MSFRIFCSGTGGYSHRRSGMQIGDLFAAATWARRATSPLSGGASAAMGEAASHLPGSDNLQQGAGAVARMTGAGLLEQSLHWITIDLGTTHFCINCNTEHMMWTDRSDNAIFTIQGNSSSPMGDFMSATAPVLEEHAMNGFGVLDALGVAFRGYHARGARASNQSRVLVQLFN